MKTNPVRTGITRLDEGRLLLAASARWMRACQLALAAAIAALVVGGGGAHAAFMREAVNIDRNAKGLGGFVNSSQTVLDGAMVVVVALAPIALVGAALLFAFGSRRAGLVALGALGAILLTGSANGFIR